MRDLSELATGFVVILLMICVAISAPYAWREMKRDWTKLRGQFGMAFCLVCIGIAGQLAIRWAFWQTNSINASVFWRAAEPVSLLFTILISAGILVAIRAMTVENNGERVWARSAAASAAISTLIWFMF